MFDLGLDIIEENDVLHLDFSYSSRLFAHETVVRWAGYFETLLQQLVTDPDRPLGVSNSADRKNVNCSNATMPPRRAYPATSTLVDLFEQQVSATPENTAVVCGGASLSYRELNARANRVAHCLRDRPWRPARRFRRAVAGPLGVGSRYRSSAF